MLKECISCGKIVETEEEQYGVLCSDCSNLLAEENEKDRKINHDIKQWLYNDLFGNIFEGWSFE